MAKLVQTKIEAENEAEEDEDNLAQMDLDINDNFDHYLYWDLSWVEYYVKVRPILKKFWSLFMQ